VFVLVREFNDRMKFPMRVILNKESKTIHWGEGQEWIIITTDEKVFDLAPRWAQFLIKG
jgi:hypothetical protein